MCRRDCYWVASVLDDGPIDGVKVSGIVYEETSRIWDATTPLMNRVRDVNAIAGKRN